MRRLITSAVLGLSLSGPALAGDVALIVGNDAYGDLPRNPAGDEVLGAVRALERAGVTVISGENRRAADLDRLFGDFLKALEEGDAPNRVAVILSGQFAETANDAYFLPVDADDETDINTVRDTGLALSAVLSVLAAAPGEALLVLGEGRDSGALGAYLSYGATLPSVPQGVTVLRGAASDVADFARETLAARETPTVNAAEVDYGLIAEGYLPRGRVFFAAQDSAQPATESGGITAPAPLPRVNEAELWATTRQADTIGAYRSYLDAFPDGPNAETARKMIREIETEPFRAERLAEQGLRLSREDKRSIQRNLTLLEFDPRGIDGLFGRGSRAAIGSWQGANGFAATTYLTGNQIALLASQAERRAAELEEEARIRRELQEREDRAYWQQTGALGDAPGLRAYLRRYPARD